MWLFFLIIALIMWAGQYYQDKADREWREKAHRSYMEWQGEIGSEAMKDLFKK